MNSICINHNHIDNMH